MTKTYRVHVSRTRSEYCTLELEVEDGTSIQDIKDRAEEEAIEEPDYEWDYDEEEIRAIDVIEIGKENNE